MGDPHKILVLDDEPQLCAILKKTLSREGYEVLAAGSGLRALNILKKEKVDLLLVDLKMPRMDGLEFLKRARKGGARIPAIILTAHGSLSSAREAMGLGAVDYLTKPFDLSEVVRLVREALPEKNGKYLIYVPTLHTAHDMGTVAPSMKEMYVKKFGEQKWDEHVRVIGEMWEGIRTKIEALSLPFSRVKVYQDGLPLCGKEKEIIRELASKGSPNHKIVQWLMDQGATVEGTEDPKLLLAEYSHIKKIAEARTHAEKEKLTRTFSGEQENLLKKRDETIRDRIVATLKKGETGILFMGLLHRVDELLPKEIRVSYLIHRLPFRRGFDMKRVA